MTLKISLNFKSKFVFIIFFPLISNGTNLLTLVNIYTPNEDDPKFFQLLFEHLSAFRSEEIIIGGDYNLVLDPEKDKKGGLARTHKNALKVINDLSEESRSRSMLLIQTLFPTSKPTIQ